jgi:hypothetical protein
MKVQCTKCGTEIDRTVRLSTVVCFQCKQFFASLRKLEAKKAGMKKPVKHRVKKPKHRIEKIWQQPMDCNIVKPVSDMGYYIKGEFYPTIKNDKKNII